MDRMESVEQRVPLLSLERPSYIDVYRDDGVFPQDGRDSQAAMQDAATTSFPSHGTGTSDETRLVHEFAVNFTSAYSGESR